MRARAQQIARRSRISITTISMITMNTLPEEGDTILMLNRTQPRVRLLIIRYKENLHEEVCKRIL